MECPVCKGTGVPKIPHVPSNSGGWLDRKYTWVSSRCGACNGSGMVPDNGADSRCEQTGDNGGQSEGSGADTERLVESVMALLNDPVDSLCDMLQKQFRFGCYRKGLPCEDSELNRHMPQVDRLKLELLEGIHLCDDIPERFRAEMAILVSRIEATSIYEYRQAMGYFSRNKPHSGAPLIQMGLDRLHQAIWDHEKQARLGLW